MCVWKWNEIECKSQSSFRRVFLLSTTTIGLLRATTSVTQGRFSTPPRQYTSAIQVLIVKAWFWHQSKDFTASTRGPMNDGELSTLSCDECEEGLKVEAELRITARSPSTAIATPRTWRTRSWSTPSVPSVLVAAAGKNGKDMMIAGRRMRRSADAGWGRRRFQHACDGHKPKLSRFYSSSTSWCSTTLLLNGSLGINVLVQCLEARRLSGLGQWGCKETCWTFRPQRPRWQVLRTHSLCFIVCKQDIVLTSTTICTLC